MGEKIGRPDDGPVLRSLSAILFDTIDTGPGAIRIVDLAGWRSPTRKIPKEFGQSKIIPRDINTVFVPAAEVPLLVQHSEQWLSELLYNIGSTTTKLKDENAASYRTTA